MAATGGFRQPGTSSPAMATAWFNANGANSAINTGRSACQRTAGTTGAVLLRLPVRRLEASRAIPGTQVPVRPAVPSVDVGGYLTSEPSLLTTYGTTTMTSRRTAALANGG